jgi:hypothetical protein
MVTSLAVARPHRRTAVALVVASCALVGLQAWNILRWARAFDRGSTQAARVNLYLHGFPLGMGELGTSALTWISLLLAAIGLVTAFAAGWLLAGTARAATLVLVGVNAILVLWYVFTLMQVVPGGGAAGRLFRTPPTVSD